MTTANIIAACACAATSQRETERPKSQKPQCEHSSCLPEPIIRVKKQYYFEPCKVVLPSSYASVLQEPSDSLKFHTISIPAMELTITQDFLISASVGVSEFMRESFGPLCTILDRQDEEVIDKYFLEVCSEHDIDKKQLPTPKYTTQYFWTFSIGEHLSLITEGDKI